MDNGTSEYVFVTTFFAPEPDLPPVQTPQVVSSHLFSPIALPTPLPGDDPVSSPASEVAPVTPRPRERTDSVFSNESLRPSSRLSKEDLAALNAVWKQIMDPALEHAKVVFTPFNLSFLTCFFGFFWHSRVSTEIRTSRVGTRAACDTSPHDDTIHRGGHERDTEARLSGIGVLRFWPPAADVAALPESDDGSCRGPQKSCRRRRRGLLPPCRHNE